LSRTTISRGWSSFSVFFQLDGEIIGFLEIIGVVVALFGEGLVVDRPERKEENREKDHQDPPFEEGSSEKGRGDDQIRDMRRRMFRVPIQEIRKKPVAKVPRIDPRVEKA